VTSQRAARCCDASRAAGEPLAATATTTERWLLVEVPGTWPRDVTAAGCLPEVANAAVGAWLARTPRSRLLFVRRPGRAAERPFVAAVRSQEAVAETRRFEVESLHDLAGADFDADGELVATDIVLVCGHGSRDACCALHGTSVFGALAGKLGGEKLWISSHQGGHRFAANVLVLPLGLQLGRLGPDTAPSAVARALAGGIELEHFRGRTFREAKVQAAEHAIREATGIDGVHELSLVAVDESVVRFHGRDGTEHAALVEEEAGAVVPASCGATPEPQRTFSARVL
jgi:hypothetical protein